jgi:acetyl-CoA carboxylase carboxyltransferase component
MEGNTVAIVANQPTELAGCLDIDASVKGARYDSFLLLHCLFIFPSHMSHFS